MTHAEQIKKRIKYFKMSIVHDEYGEVKWLCDSLTLAVTALARIIEPTDQPQELEHAEMLLSSIETISRNALTKIGAPNG